MRSTPKNPTITKNVIDAIQAYFRSVYGGIIHRNLWKDVNTYCLFIGYPRSGHSLIGALLNAHPNMMVAHELGALKYVYAGFSKWQIYYLLMKKAQLSGEKGRKLGGYIYDVPNQWQGRVKNLQVIGDKQGEGTTLRIQANSRYISRLRNIINVNIMFIHIVRNPYDNITTMAKKKPEFNSDLNKSINYYFSLCDTIAQFKTTINSDDIFECKQELFINDPKNQLKNLCDFLGVEAIDDYLNDCAKVVYKSPHKARYDVDWNSELIDLVKNRIEQFSFLHGYSYED